MTLAIGGLICGLMTYWAVANPMRAILLYGFTASYADGAGVGSWLSSGLTEFRSIAGGIFVLASIVAASRALLEYRQIESKFLRPAILLSILALVWSLLGALYKGQNPIEAASLLPYLGITAFLAFLTQTNRRTGERDFLIFLCAQAFLASSILLFPALHFLRAPSTIFDNRGVNLAIADPGFNKYDFVQSAQFHNPNALGLYGATAIGVAFVFLLSRSRYPLLWFLLLVAGVVMWLNAFTRGPIVGVALSAALLLLITYRRSPFVVFYAIVILLIGLALSSSERVMSLLIPDAQNVSVSLREEAFANGVRALDLFPVFGVPTDWIWSGTPPHVLPLAFGAQHGILVGACLVLIVFLLGPLMVLVTLRRASDVSTRQVGLSLMILPLLGIALTNNFAAPVLFWALFAVAISVCRQRGVFEQRSAARSRLQTPAP